LESENYKFKIYKMTIARNKPEPDNREMLASRGFELHDAGRRYDPRDVLAP
jgi:hypothetical protein